MKGFDPQRIATHRLRTAGLGTSEHVLANHTRRFGWARGIDRAANAGEAGTSPHVLTYLGCQLLIG